MVLDVEREPGDSASDGSCIFCAIVRSDAPAEIVLDDPAGVAFLDRRPLLPGSCLDIMSRPFPICPSPR